MASLVCAGKIIRDLGLTCDYTLVVIGSVQEEDCDGLCWQYIIKESGLKPEFVVFTEPTDGGIYRGQRGRMEIKVAVKGVSSHGSAPERGDNAIFKMGCILGELETLHSRLKVVSLRSILFIKSRYRCTRQYRHKIVAPAPLNAYSFPSNPVWALNSSIRASISSAQAGIRAQ